MQQLQLAVLLALAASCYCHILRDPNAGTSSWIRPFRSIKAPAETISNYDIVRPIILHTDNMKPHPRELWVSIKTEDNASNFTLKLELNENLIPHNFQSKHYDDSGREVISKGHVNCFYHGDVLGHPEWTATMSTCHGLQGSFGDPSDKSHHYHIEPLNNLDASLHQPHAFYLDSEHSPETGTCGCNHTHDSDGVPNLEEMVGGMELQRLRRQTRNGFLFVEWIVVNDNRQYIRYGRNLTATVQRALEVANKVDSLFRVLNIRVSLKESITWTGGDQITVTSDANTLLNNFRRYQPRITTAHDSAMLLTGIDLDGGTVGIAFVRTMCSDTHSVGVTQDRGRAISSVGVTAAHELGHIFNMGHDGSDCTCTDSSRQCIMNAFGGWPPSTQWSSCSRADLNTGLNTHNLGRCLTNEPTKTVGDPACGNGIQEENEACDCGSPQECRDPCCNASTCQLAAGAQCHAGDCCNSTCQYKVYGTTCRAADGECDIAEYCSGDSGECPADDHKLDGTACDSNTGYCYEGECPSHDSQCQFHFGSGSRKGATRCYSQNVNGNTYGNCGHSSTAFQQCAASDVLCGQLQCTRGQYQSRIRNLAITINTAYVYLQSSRRFEGCQSFTTQPGAVDTNSPGLVLDGTKCGSNLMCQDQRCIPVSQITTLSCPTGSNGQVCSGNGQCNNHGQCSCNMGFTGTTCQTATTGPNNEVPTTQPTTQSTTQPPTTQPTTQTTTQPPTTQATTQPPTTQATTQPPTTQATTQPPTTETTTQPPTTDPCGGGELTASSGNFTTPNWPMRYHINLDCEWTIRLPDSNKRVQFTFAPVFGLAGKMGRCTNDYVKIFDGSGGVELGKFCGSTAPSPVTVSTSSARVVLHSGSNHNLGRKGFKLTYQSTTEPPTTYPCGGGVVTASSGNLTTPNWPFTYPINISDCEWTIRLPDSNKRVQFTFAPGFGLEGKMGRCTNDYVKIFDGSGSVELGKFCGSTVPSPVTVSTSSARVVLRSGPIHNLGRKGFKLTYQSTTEPPTTYPCGGGVVTASSGNLTTPNWPFTYPVNIDCEWTIRLPDSNKRVQFTFAPGFGLEGRMDQRCTSDYVKIFDGSGSVELGKFCSSTVPSPVTVSTSSARVVLHSGPSHNLARKGFKLTYQSTTEPPTTYPCGGGVVTASSGNLTTPNWPFTYPVNIDCEWTIRLPDSNKRVRFTFAPGFGLAGRMGRCTYDYVKIFDGSGGVELGKFCGSTVPSPVTVSTSSARVVLHAGPNHNRSRKGFKITYQSVDL